MHNLRDCMWLQWVAPNPPSSNWQVHVHQDFIFSWFLPCSACHWSFLAPSAAWLHIAKTLPRTDKRECCCRRSWGLCSAPWLLFMLGGTWYLRQSEGKSFQTTFLEKDPLHWCFGTARHMCLATWLRGMSVAHTQVRPTSARRTWSCSSRLRALSVGATLLYPATVFFLWLWIFVNTLMFSFSIHACTCAIDLDSPSPKQHPWLSMVWNTLWSTPKQSQGSPGIGWRSWMLHVLGRICNSWFHHIWMSPFAMQYFSILLQPFDWFDLNWYAMNRWKETNKLHLMTNNIAGNHKFEKYVAPAVSCWTNLFLHDSMGLLDDFSWSGAFTVNMGPIFEDCPITCEGKDTNTKRACLKVYQKGMFFNCCKSREKSCHLAWFTWFTVLDI